MIDTHCHLTFPDYRGRIDEELAEARRAGVTGCITVSTTSEDCLDALAVAEAHEGVWCTAGVHPLYADRGPHRWESLREVARHDKCVAWGELGLDNHYADPPKREQHRVLADQLAFIQSCWSAEGDDRIDLPIVIHCREAFEDLIPILKATAFDPGRFVFHCFTGGPDDMRRVLDFGAMVSFTGVATYRNATEVRQAAKLVPLDRIMVETDAPFLSPEPYRGKRPCRPAWVRHVAESLAACRADPFDVFHEAVNANTERFFGIKVGVGS